MGNEDTLIARIRRALPSSFGKRSNAGARLLLGVGDDAAILAPGRGSNWVLTCDAFFEGVHFLGDVHPPDSVGYKSLVRAISDIAAMGGTPRFFLLTLALPAARTGRWLDEFLKGMSRAARGMGIVLAGGDTTKNTKVAISITVLGEVKPGRAVLRSGARPGDLIYVTGRLGRAELGLELIRRDVGRQAWAVPLVRHHLYPPAKLELGAWLARRRLPTAMMDLSDGLSTDLARLCVASRVGACLSANKIPQVRTSQRQLKRIRRLRLDPQRLALHGGDDYGLLFTVPPSRVPALRSAPGFSALTAIGEITPGRRILLADSNGRTTVLKPLGWDPFRRKLRT
jgi:thiamine-monophosphate kinase